MFKMNIELPQFADLVIFADYVYRALDTAEFKDWDTTLVNVDLNRVKDLEMKQHVTVHENMSMKDLMISCLKAYENSKDPLQVDWPQARRHITAFMWSAIGSRNPFNI